MKVLDNMKFLRIPEASNTVQNKYLKTVKNIKNEAIYIYFFLNILINVSLRLEDKSFKTIL